MKITRRHLRRIITEYYKEYEETLEDHEEGEAIPDELDHAVRDSGRLLVVIAGEGGAALVGPAALLVSFHRVVALGDDVQVLAGAGDVANLCGTRVRDLVGEGRARELLPRDVPRDGAVVVLVPKCVERCGSRAVELEPNDLPLELDLLLGALLFLLLFPLGPGVAPLGGAAALAPALAGVDPERRPAEDAAHVPGGGGGGGGRGDSRPGRARQG